MQMFQISSNIQIYANTKIINLTVLSVAGGGGRVQILTALFFLTVLFDPLILTVSFLLPN